MMCCMHGRIFIEECTGLEGREEREEEVRVRVHDDEEEEEKERRTTT